MEFKVQSLLYPDNEICNVQQLYYRCSDEINFINGKVSADLFGKDSTTISFDTYFNSFSIGKWIKFTNITNVIIRMKTLGKGVIRVYKSKLELDEVNKSLVRDIYFESNHETVLSIDLDLDDFTFKDTIHFEIKFANKKSYARELGYWVKINSSDVNSISLALASCTYKKERYINKTLSLIDKHVISANPEYNIKSYIVDNGGTLDYDICKKYQRVTLIKSDNLGASGGFSRALYCALTNDDNYVVSLDDDILLNPHSINLLYNFLRCMKQQYTDYAIAGAMLVYDKQYLQHDAGAYIEKNRLYGIHSNLDLRSYYNCLMNSVSEYHDKTFNGFWFCCYPVNQLKIKGLAYPFFMKGDDVELGIRIFNKRMITLNGISTWHESFYKKFTPVYSNIYELRNLLIIYSTQFEDYSAFDACKLFLKRAFRELMFYRYDGAILNCKAVELFLEGSNGISNINNSQIVSDNQIYKLKDASSLVYDFSYADYKKSIGLKKEPFYKRLVRGLTFNGNLLPSFLLKKSVIVPTVTASFRSVFGYKSIIHYSFDEDKAYITKNSKKDFFKAAFKVLIKAYSLFIKYKSIRKDFKSNFSSLTSIDAWERKFKQSDRN
ncbi:glycosyltransferase [Franconibacter helveticus]|uniref:glycosyltransferase n=1 Tax=Franconibacter helveticus TaxID=357240 RepID=UPI000B01445B|nr:glycosyltransferase [Franconibacter helveticus]